MRTSPPLTVDADDEATLREWVVSTRPAFTRRARIVLLSAEGWGPTAVASEIGCSKQTVITWRERYRAGGVKGLLDAPRSGRPVSVDPVAVIERTLQHPPPRLRANRWSSRLLAAEIGVSNVAVANIWRGWGVVPTAGGTVRLLTDPPLGPVVGPLAAVHLGRDISVVALSERENGAPVVPVRERPRIGARFDALDLGDDMADPTTVLDGLGDDRRGLRLLADTMSPKLESWAGRHGVGVHVVPPGVAWARLVRVLVVLVGETPRGAASVERLRAALADHVAGRPFRWHDRPLLP